MWLFAARNPNYFSGLLELRLQRDGGALDLDAVPTPLDERESRVTLDLPDWMCYGPGRTLTLAGAAALVDEASTFGGMCLWDSGFRPGVSCSLELEATAPEGGIALTSSNRATVVTRLRKAGRTLGFLDVEVLCASTGRWVI